MRMAELTSQVTFRVTNELYETVQEIARRERRKANEVSRALLERGIAAYERDSRLFEPEATHSENGTSEAGQRVESRDTIRVRKRLGGRLTQKTADKEQPRRKVK